MIPPYKVPPSSHRVCPVLFFGGHIRVLFDGIDTWVQVPEGMEVSLVSVVGAFRTGKSFLLSFFLRFLHSGCVRACLLACCWLVLI